jgi:site-specific recombinase XerD
VTHGDAWLPSLLTTLASHLTLISFSVRRCPRTSVAYRGETRPHTESDLRVFLRWCTDQGLDPLAAVRVDIERYLRWLQDVRRYQPSTVSRRLSVVVGFY